MRKITIQKAVYLIRFILKTKQYFDDNEGTMNNNHQSISDTLVIFYRYPIKLPLKIIIMIIITWVLTIPVPMSI
jgi:hypothetical protein